MKRKYLLAAFMIIATVIIYYGLDLRNAEAYRQISEGNFQIKYFYEPSLKGYKLETQILSDGRFERITSYENNMPDKVEKGSYSKEKVKDFVKFAVKHNVLKMNERMDADVMDGANIFFEIRIGEKTVKAGGYTPMHVSKNFGKILDQFHKLSGAFSGF